NYQSVNTISWKGGISFEYQLNPILAVELGADYTEYRLRVEKGDDDYFDESSLKSINLPLLLKLKLGGRKVHAFIGGGVEGSYFLSMKHHYFRQSGDLVFEEFFGEDEAKFGKKMADLLQSRFSYSVVGLAGFQVGPFYSEARYCLGLKDIALDLSDTAYGEIVNAGRMKGWSALFGFRF
ncbi:MAG: outer membrane beta-barrel protein, partial [Candidatus Aminicenantes bacterium]